MNEILLHAIDTIQAEMNTLLEKGIIEPEGNAHSLARVLLAKLWLIKAGIKD